VVSVCIMLSGQKRPKRDYDDAEPPLKRQKRKRKKHPWPTKQPPLSAKQLSELPALLNPSLHKNVFESFWRKKGFGAPQIDTFSSDASTPTQPMFQCQILCVDPKDEQHRISVLSEDFDSKKKATVNAYYRFNIAFIPSDVLALKMRPFSSSRKVNVAQVSTEWGQHLKDRTASIVVEPVPLQMHEMDAINVLYSKQRDKEKIDSHKLVRFIDFDSVGDGALYKKLRIQFVDKFTASKFVQFLNGKKYKKSKLRVTWHQELASKRFLSPTRSLKVVGLPMEIQDNAIRRFLGGLGVFPQTTARCNRFSLFLELFVTFEEREDAAAAFQSINAAFFEGVPQRDGSVKKRNKVRRRRLYARYALQSELEEAKEYKADLARKWAEVAKTSKCIDVEGIAWDTKESEIEAVFKKYGNVERVHINHRKDLMPGSAFVAMSANTEAVRAVLALNSHVLNGVALKLAIHSKQTKEEKKEIRKWYAERREGRIQELKERKADSRMRRRQKQRKRRIRKTGSASRSRPRPKVQRKGGGVGDDH